MRHVLSLLGLSLIVWCALFRGAQAQKVVLGGKGNWWDSRRNLLSTGSRVSGPCVYGESEFLQVVDSKTMTAKVFIYDELPADCQVACPAKAPPIPVNARCSIMEPPQSQVSESPVTHPVNEAHATMTQGPGAYLDLLSRKPQMFVVAAARGIEEEPQEAVLPLTGAEVDLAPALQTVSAGKYAVTLEPLDGGKSGSEDGKVTWVPGAPAKIQLSRSKPGLYRLSITLESGESEGSDAWVLVVAPSHFDARAKEFGETVNIAKSWGDKVDSAGKRALLRACLQSLADQVAGK